MGHEDSQWGNGAGGSNRRPSPKFGGDPSDPNYSPSTSYNYSPGAGNYQSSQNQQHPRRRTDRFKREAFNFNDRVVKQNDLIIRLLKEIRDRLPPREGGAPGHAGLDAEPEGRDNQDGGLAL
jgi:hypothetical protein